MSAAVKAGWRVICRMQPMSALIRFFPQWPREPMFGTKQSQSMPLLTPGNMTPFARFMSSNTSPIHWGSGVTWCNARDQADESMSPSRSGHSEFRVQRAPSSPELVERDFFAYPGRPSRPDRRGYRACTVLHDSIIYWMGRFAPKLTADRYFRAYWIWYGALAWSWLFGRACNALFRVPASAVPSGLLLVACKPRTPG